VSVHRTHHGLLPTPATVAESLERQVGIRRNNVKNPGDRATAGVTTLLFVLSKNMWCPTLKPIIR
jgi:hypothetical protein